MAVFKVQHFSDTHHAINPTRATLKKMSERNVDARIHTGDAVYNCFDDDYSYLAPYDFMIAVGNHDFISKYGAEEEHYVNGEMDWRQQPTELQVYNKFIVPTLKKNPVSIQTGKTYWSRDYKDNNIRIIGYNSCLLNDALAQQRSWLYSQLQECLNNNIKVFLACHYPPYDVYATRCCFTDEMVMPDLLSNSYGVALNLYSGIQIPYLDLCSFANRGLSVLGMMCGHEHSDGLFAGGTDSKFPILMVASVVIDRPWCNLSRSDDVNSPACCLFNQYEYDDTQNTLRIYRIGANGRRTGELCKMAIWDYSKSDFVNFFSRRKQ